MNDETFGFNGYTLAELSQVVSKVLSLPPILRNNSYWYDYYLFEPNRGGGSNDHTLVWNEIPPQYTDPDEAAEPDFLDYKIIFWTAHGYESPELRQALLAIPGAKLLRERVPNKRPSEQE